MNDPTPVPSKRTGAGSKVMAAIGVAGISLLIAGAVSDTASLSVVGFIMLMVSGCWFFIV